MKKDVLGIKIDDISIDEIAKTVQGWLSKSGKHYIVTPNPEIVMMAQKDQELKSIINNADLAIPDGAGLKLTGDIRCLSPGIDVMEKLVKMASERGFTIGLLGGRGQVANETAERLLRKYPKLKVIFAKSGGEIDEEGRQLSVLSPQFSDSSSQVVGIPITDKQKTEKQNSENKQLKTDTRKTDLLFVAFGPPKQEKWIYKNLDKLDIKVAMGVGGAFDYISGTVPRAPIWIRNLGFEWLFRLAVQPWRIKRQLALVKYLFYVKLNSW